MLTFVRSGNRHNEALPRRVSEVLPIEWVAFLEKSSGGCASSKHCSIQLFDDEQLEKVNEANWDPLENEALVLIATNGADESYAVSTRADEAGAIYLVPLTSLNRQDAILIAPSLDEFLTSAGLPPAFL